MDHQQGAIVKRNLLAEQQFLWPREIHSHALTLEGSGYNSGAGIESRLAVWSGFSLNEPGEATRPIAAHVGAASVAVVKFPGPIRLAGGAGNQKEEAVCADAALAMADPDDLLAGKLNIPVAIID